MFQVGFFDDFKGEDTLLLWGDADGLAAFLHGLETLARGAVAEVEVGRGNSPAILKIRRDAATASKVVFAGEEIVWTLSNQALADAVSKTSALNQPGPGHQHFDVTGPLISTVTVSKAEYPPELPVRIAD